MARREGELSSSARLGIATMLLVLGPPLTVLLAVEPVPTVLVLAILAFPHLGAGRGVSLGGR